VNAHEQFLTDPAFAASFTAAYAGRHEPADALWWLEHPTSAGPSGAHSPLAELAALKNAAFARGADAAAHESLARLEAEASADRGATLEALAAARTPPEPEPLREAEDEASVARSRRWPLIATIAVAALLVGGLAGRQVALATAEPEVILVGTPGPTVTRTIAPFTPTDAPAMLDVFGDAQEPDDIPTVALDSVSANSTRLLGRHSADSDSGTFAVYAAELVPGFVACLVIVFSATGEESHTCTSETDMPDLGLSLVAQHDDFWGQASWATSGRVHIQGGSLSEADD